MQNKEYIENSIKTLREKMKTLILTEKKMEEDYQKLSQQKKQTMTMLAWKEKDLKELKK